jgi:undecaprenyl-diphosphatase
MQAMAILPGISRSGATITAGRVMGLDRESSAKFAFHIAIPAIGAAFLWHLFKAVKGSFPVEWMPCMIGLAVAAVVGYLSLVLFFGIIKKMNFMIFAAYCIALFLVCRYLMI